MPEPDPDPVPESLATGPDADAQTGRQRLWLALRTPSRRQVVVAVLLAVVGFGGIVQIRANEVDDTYAGLRDQDLIDILDGLAGTTQRTQTELDRLTKARRDLLSDSRQRKAAIKQAQDQADDLAVLAGVVPVTGPGIRLTITEEQGTVSVTSILDTIEELRSVNAEAIQINGRVRVVAQTAFEQGVGGLLVDGTLVESPYVIDVIGTPSALAGAVEFALGPRKQLELDGATVDVDELTSLDIETVRQPVQSEFAQPN